MAATHNNLRAATAALSAIAIILLAAILLTLRPSLASADESQAKEAAEGNISLSVPATLDCFVKADGSVITPDADKYAIKNEGTIAVAVAAPTVQPTEGAGTISMSAQAAVIDTVNNNDFEYELKNATGFSWIYGNKGQSEQTLESGQSLCAKFAITPLTREHNANALDQAATSNGFNLATINFAYKEKGEEPKAYVVFFNGGKTAKLFKGFDKPEKNKPYRGSSELVFDYVEDIEIKR